MQDSSAPLTRKEFFDLYWFSPFQMVTLINPKTTDYNFMVEMRHFVIRAGATEQMPGTVANVYLSQMTRILAQDEDKMNYLSDFNLMKQYYNRLIVDVKNMMNEAENRPSYLDQVPKTMIGSEPETPPWQQKDSEPEVQVPETPAPNTEQKETSKEFEHEGNSYKMVIAKDGRSMFYKNGRMTGEAEYAKAASMA